MLKKARRKKQSPTQCQSNVYARYEALRKALLNPKSSPKAVLEGCKSQERLAALNFPRLDITPMARNSMYKYADLVLKEHKVPSGTEIGKNGRQYLNWLRKEVKNASTQGARSRTKHARAERVKQLKQKTQEELNQVRVHSLALSKAYLHLLTQIKSMNNNDNIDSLTQKRITNLIHDHDRLYSHLFDETGSFRPNNVEPIK